MNTIKNSKNQSPSDGLAATIKQLWSAVPRFHQILVPVTLVVVLIASIGVCHINSSSQSFALASKCTLSILAGNVVVIIPGTSEIQPGTSGMTLDAGNRVKTSPDATALLTFFDGSTLKLEPGTDIEIEQLERNDDQHTITIVLKQWTGDTWSHVVKMADRGSRYEIKTPSAVALVRGTQFLTEVDISGATKVLTTEGLVSVSAQGEEILLPVGQQTTVEPGTPPSEPKTVDVNDYIPSQEEHPKGNNSHTGAKAVATSQSQHNSPNSGEASAHLAKVEAKATAEAAKVEAKATAEAAREEAKATAEAAKVEAKATAEAAREEAKAAAEEAKAAAEAAREEAKNQDKDTGQGNNESSSEAATTSQNQGGGNNQENAPGNSEESSAEPPATPPPTPPAAPPATHPEKSEESPDTLHGKSGKAT